MSLLPHGALMMALAGFDHRVVDYFLTMNQVVAEIPEFCRGRVSPA